ncbi:hypothetical protein ACFYWN_44055 [Streptomyces sp. NPDC002917]|uniref:hypothetical protein n=1 Tax=Streptomyces sp. NPDC002917 TaxID=3364671 RepID=UPI00369F26C5
MHISATNPLPCSGPPSYHFSSYNRIWGWATWARAWQHNDPAIRGWPAWKAQRAHHPHFPDPAERRLWEDRWDAIHRGDHRENWNHQWFLACLMHGGKAIVPAANSSPSSDSGPTPPTPPTPATAKPNSPVPPCSPR